MAGTLSGTKRQGWSNAVWREAEDGRPLIFHSPNIVNLCMDFYDYQRQEGRLYHQYTTASILFTSIFEALKLMDGFYEEIRFPQSSTEPRSFLADRRNRERRKGRKEMPKLPEYERKDPEKVESFDKVIEHRGKDATFIIRVQYRQNASWQGEVTWVDGQKKEHFRSALELVRLIDSAMEEAKK